MISSTRRTVRYPVWEAGLISEGTPAIRAGASFSSGPHTGEVERVDLDGHAEPWREQVLAQEVPGLAELLRRALDEDSLIRQLALGLARVAEQHADAAVDVELGVRQRRAGPVGELVELLAVLAQHRAQRLGQRRALVEGQLPQRGAAGRPAVGQRGAEVHAIRGDLGDLLPGDRVVDRGSAVRREPAAFYVTGQHRHQRSLLPEIFTYRPFGNLLYGYGD